jgi:hypothetical protein
MNLNSEKSPLLKLSIISGLLLASSHSFAAPGVVAQILFPKGSAGDKIDKTLWLPCMSDPTAEIAGETMKSTKDLVEFKVTVKSNKLNSDGTGSVSDLYVIFSTDAIGGHYYYLESPTNTFVSAVVINQVSDVAALNDEAKSKPYVKKEDFYSDSLTKNIFSGPVTLDGGILPQGIWLMTAILADSSDPNFDFKDPKTWTAWSTTPFILGAPWGVGDSYGGTSGTGKCE